MKFNPLCIILTTALVSSAVGSAVVASAPAAAPSSEAAVKKHDETIETIETSTSGSGGSNQILVGSEVPPTDPRPTDGTIAGTLSTAVGSYVPPNSVFEGLVKTAAKSSEVAENSPSENFIHADVHPPSTKDTKPNDVTVVTAEYCYECIEATVWTFGGTDDTTKSARKSADVSSSADDIGIVNGNGLAVKDEEDEEEDAPVGPVIVTVDTTSNTPDDAGMSPGPVNFAKTIVTAYQTMVDTTDALADIASPNVPSTSTSTSLPTSEAEAEAKAEQHGLINGTAANVDGPPHPPSNGSNVTATSVTNATSATSGNNNPEVGGDDDKSSIKTPRITDEEDGMSKALVVYTGAVDPNPNEYMSKELVVYEGAPSTVPADAVSSSCEKDGSASASTLKATDIISTDTDAYAAIKSVATEVEEDEDGTEDKEVGNAATVGPDTTKAKLHPPSTFSAGSAAASKALVLYTGPVNPNEVDRPIGDTIIVTTTSAMKKRKQRSIEKLMKSLEDIFLHLFASAFSAVAALILTALFAFEAARRSSPYCISEFNDGTLFDFLRPVGKTVKNAFKYFFGATLAVLFSLFHFVEFLVLDQIVRLEDAYYTGLWVKDEIIQIISDDISLARAELPKLFERARVAIVNLPGKLKWIVSRLALGPPANSTEVAVWDDDAAKTSIAGVLMEKFIHRIKSFSMLLLFLSSTTNSSVPATYPAAGAITFINSSVPATYPAAGAITFINSTDQFCPADKNPFATKELVVYEGAPSTVPSDAKVDGDDDDKLSLKASRINDEKGGVLPIDDDADAILKATMEGATKLPQKEAAKPDEEQSINAKLLEADDGDVDAKLFGDPEDINANLLEAPVGDAKLFDDQHDDGAKLSQPDDVGAKLLEADDGDVDAKLFDEVDDDGTILSQPDDGYANLLEADDADVDAKLVDSEDIYANLLEAPVGDAKLFDEVDDDGAKLSQPDDGYANLLEGDDGDEDAKLFDDQHDDGTKLSQPDDVDANLLEAPVGDAKLFDNQHDDGTILSQPDDGHANLLEADDGDVDAKLFDDQHDDGTKLSQPDDVDANLLEADDGDVDAKLFDEVDDDGTILSQPDDVDANVLEADDGDVDAKLVDPEDVDASILEAGLALEAEDGCVEEADTIVIKGDGTGKPNATSAKGDDGTDETKEQLSDFVEGDGVLLQGDEDGGDNARGIVEHCQSFGHALADEFEAFKTNNPDLFDCIYIGIVFFLFVSVGLALCIYMLTFYMHD